MYFNPPSYSLLLHFFHQLYNLSLCSPFSLFPSSSSSFFSFQLLLFPMLREDQCPQIRANTFPEIVSSKLVKFKAFLQFTYYLFSYGTTKCCQSWPPPTTIAKTNTIKDVANIDAAELLSVFVSVMDSLLVLC